MKFSKVIVLVVILLNIGFTLGVFYVALKGYSIPDSLIVAWFGFTTGELWLLSRIKINEPMDSYKGDDFIG